MKAALLKWTNFFFFFSTSNSPTSPSALQTQPNFLRDFTTPCPIPSWKVLIHRTDNLIMRRTYYWYYAAEARLPWSPSKRHLIFSPPSSLSMGPSVVENEFSLICMTDKHILYLSHRRSCAMDLGTRERERETEWGGEMMRGLTSMNEVNGVYVCVWVSVGLSSMCACVCIMHGHVMFMYALLFIPMSWLCSHVDAFEFAWARDSVCLCM